MPADEIGERGRVELLDVVDACRGTGALDVGDVVGVPDHCGDLVTAACEDRSELEGDAAVAAEHDDSGHASRLTATGSDGTGSAE
ncbi:hypothetical protein GCM10009803_02530 [Microbacterium ginsengiterrae]